MAYVELHAHSAYSFLDGASLPEELVAAAIEHGYPALALTDHDGLYGSLEFAQAAKSLGLRAITGAEVTLEDNSHLTLLVEDRAGYRNLCRLLTKAHEETRDWSVSRAGGDGRDVPARARSRNARTETGARALRAPSLSLDFLMRHAEGLICLSGCARDGLAIRRPDRLGKLVDAFGRENFFIELQRPFWRDDRARNRRLAQLAGNLGVSCVATGNVHAHDYCRSRLQDTFVAARLLSTLDQTEPQRRGNTSSVLVSPAEMEKRFADHPDAVFQTERIAECCRFDLTRDLGYRYPGSQDPRADRKLAELCTARLEQRYSASERREPRARLEEELRVIEKLRLSGFFLLHHDMLELASEVAAEVRGSDTARSLLPPGRGRGSSVSSIVCYLTGLSHIDPVRNKLFLGRFLNEELNALPDIDLDFPRDIREKLIPRVHKRYGPDRAALVAAFSTYRQRGVIRDLGKALGLPAGEIERVARSAEIYGGPDDFANGVTEAIGKKRAASPRWQALIELGGETYGLPRHISQHPGGMVISTEPLIDVCPVQPSAMEGRNTVQWDKDSCADAGFLKIDLLGLGMLSAAERCVTEIARVRGERVDLSRIPYDDQHVYSTIQKGDTTGVFQIESRAQIQSLLRTKPASLDDLTVQVALVRPGPIQGGAVNPYIERRMRLRQDPDYRIPYLHPSLEPVLSDTLGVIVFQDQVLEVSMALAGFSPGEAEGLRRAMSRKRSEAALLAYRERFIAGAIERGVERKIAEQIFDQVKGFSGFGFPKAHSAAFGLLAYQSTWLKVHYGPEFLAALMNEQPMGFYPPDSLIHDAQRHGVEVLPPHVNHSGVECRVEVQQPRVDGVQRAGSGLRSGVPAAGPRRNIPTVAARTSNRNSVPPAGEAAASSIAARASNGGFALAVRVGLGYITGAQKQEVEMVVRERERGGPYPDVGQLAARSGIGRVTLEKLAWADALEGLPRREALWQAGVVTPGRETSDGTQLSLPLEPPVAPRLKEMSDWERLVADYASTRVSIEQHPMQLLRPELQHPTVTSAELERLPDGSDVVIAGVAVARQRPATAGGITFMLLEDEAGTMNLVIHKQVYERHRLIVRAEPFVLAHCKLERRQGVTNLIVRRLERIDRPDLPRAEVKQIEPPVDRETGHHPAPEPTEHVAAADLRSVMPAGTASAGVAASNRSR